MTEQYQRNLQSGKYHVVHPTVILSGLKRVLTDPGLFKTAEQAVQAKKELYSHNIITIIYTCIVHGEDK